MVNHAAGKPEENTSPHQPALDTRIQRESYVAGVIVSRELQARLHKNQSLGLQIDSDTLLSGLLDAYHSRSRLDAKSVLAISESMDASLASAMQKRPGRPERR